jgi:hypothetical protein
MSAPGSQHSKIRPFSERWLHIIHEVLNWKDRMGNSYPLQLDSPKGKQAKKLYYRLQSWPEQGITVRFGNPGMIHALA